MSTCNRAYMLTLIAASIAGVPAMASDREYEFVMTSEAGDRDSVLGQSMREWARLIEEKSDGRMTADVFYQGELGGQREVFDQLIRGNIDLMITWPQTSYDNRIAVSYIPYAVLNWEDAFAAYAGEGWLSELSRPIYGELGLHYFGPFPEGFGGIATKDTYATTYEGAREKGIKVRSQPIFPLPQTINAMGFQAVPIDWNEVYTSIQTGVVDGDSSNVIYWDYEYFGDQLDYFVQSSHNFSTYALLMNREGWEEMDAEDREIVASSAEEVIATQFENARAEDRKWIEAAQAAGMEYIVPSDEDMRAWVDRVRNQVWPEIEARLGSVIMDELRANASTP